MQTESYRMWASAAFVGVLIVIGLPLWWKTTEVYRVTLPYDKIASFDPLSHKIAAELTVLANDDATASEISGLIEKVFEDSDIGTLKLKVSKAILSEDLQRTLSAVADEQEALEVVGAALDLTGHDRFYVVQRPPLFQHVWLGVERVAFFRDAKASTTLVQVLNQWVYQTSVLRGAVSDTADVARQTRFPPHDNYHISLSVVHPRPDVLTVDFDAREAVEDYVGSFVDELSVLHNFTLKSQWLYLLDFDFKGKEVQSADGKTRQVLVRSEVLPQLLTRLEERAATHVSEAATINLALYVVPCHAAPAVIIDTQQKPILSSVQAFMSPKWGGVVLSNPTAGDCAGPKPTHAPQTRLIMGAFISQLRKLLGIPETEPIPDAHLDPLRSVSPRRWETDTLLRVRTLEQITSAERTLQSLAQLLGRISNIVINDDVGASIISAVDGIRLAKQLMDTGHLVEAYNMSQAAFRAAETAFMEPSLLALLYFPDDQKYAVYIPLFLPVLFPVVVSLKNLLLWLQGKPIHKKTD